MTVVLMGSVTRISDLADEPYDVTRLPQDEWASGDYVAGEIPRMDERETAYPGLSYQLVPRLRVDPSTDFLVEERSLEQGLSKVGLQMIVENVLNSPINLHITAEINHHVWHRGHGISPASIEPAIGWIPEIARG